jgi:hypothetical protein
MEYPSFFRFSPSGQFLALGSAKKGFIIGTEYLGEFAETMQTDANKRMLRTRR